MHDDLATAIPQHLAPMFAVKEVSNRRGVQVWRVQVLNGATVAVKAATGAGDAAALPAQEAALTRAAGSTAGRVLGAGRLADGGSWMATPWWHGPSLWEDVTGVRHNARSGSTRFHATSRRLDAAPTRDRLPATCRSTNGDEPEGVPPLGTRPDAWVRWRIPASEGCLTDPVALKLALDTILPPTTGDER